MDQKLIHSPLYQYYQHVLPWEKLWTLFRCDYRRVWGFDLNNDVHLNRQFKTVEELKTFVLEKVPSKIHLGPMITSASTAATPTYEHELVLDIDLNDYADIRPCECKDQPHTCMTCWPILAAGILVLDHLIRDNFGYQQLMWVFSGRRGVHCWILDESARKLSVEARSAFADFLSVTPPKTFSEIMWEEKTIHYVFQDAFQIMEPIFIRSFVVGRNLLDPTDKWSFERVLGPNSSNSGKTSEERWKLFVQQCRQRKEMKRVYRLVFGLLYPRLDMNVTRQLNHLLKLPLSVHPQTDRICVLLKPDAESLCKLRLWDLPNIDKVIHQLDTSKNKTVSCLQSSFDLLCVENSKKMDLL
jgi:DNA primase small subunit